MAEKETYNNMEEWRDAQRVKKYVHDVEIKTWRGTIAAGLTDEQFNQMVNDIAKDREEKQKQIYMTVEDLYKKLGEFIAAGKGDNFIRVDTEYDCSTYEYTMVKEDLNRIKEIDNHIIIYSEV